MMTIDTEDRYNLYKMFVPVIFENGIDDDFYGVVAAMSNQPVLFRDKIYPPNEPMEIVEANLFLSINDIIVDNMYMYYQSVGVRQGPLISGSLRMKSYRKVLFTNTKFLFGYRFNAD